MIWKNKRLFEINFTWVQKMEGVAHLVDNFGFWDVFFHQARVRVHGILLQKKLKTKKMLACSSARTIACTFVNAGFFFSLEYARVSCRLLRLPPGKTRTYVCIHDSFH